MGREIRMVPPNWQHPKIEGWEDGRRAMVDQPMYNQTFENAKQEWLDGLEEWEAKNKSVEEGCEYWEYAGEPPTPEFYRPWKDEEATWFQLWQTVSEGSPVTPPFATKQELADYLAANGDFWDQNRCRKPDWERLWNGKPGISGWGKASAEKFVFGSGWAPSMVMVDGKFITNPGEM